MNQSFLNKRNTKNKIEGFNKYISKQMKKKLDKDSVKDH